ncbi:type II toxin-antitoxin system VapC family toxin [[Phormidium] sp. ETS-05]|uniref:type II toxin-antitoxin system VapC family toxin n=1 Tax=[Phormidium] sp. ETS-05 TaxID=222819 RepID=UPI0018EED7BC|nr:PIN domain-containing protein [[Phormidium] sp. ETS-05]
MKRQVILDAGPLVALIDRRDRFHNWAKQQWSQLEYPLLTCEAVITESCFVVKSIYGGEAGILSLLRQEVIKIAFNLADEVTAIDELMHRYKSVPMSLEDACLVRMAELNPASELLTLDSDFLIDRKLRTQPMSLIIPESDHT